MIGTLHGPQEPSLGFWRRPYHPPFLAEAVVLTLVAVSGMLAALRGLSLSLSTPPGTASLLVLEALAPLQFWGMALAAGGLALVLSLVFRNQVAVWVSHVYLTALNFCMFISLTQAIFYFNGGAGEAVLPFAAILWHGLMGLLSNPFRAETECVGRCC